MPVILNLSSIVIYACDISFKHCYSYILQLLLMSNFSPSYTYFPVSEYV